MDGRELAIACEWLEVFADLPDRIHRLAVLGHLVGNAPESVERCEICGAWTRLRVLAWRSPQADAERMAPDSTYPLCARCIRLPAWWSIAENLVRMRASVDADLVERPPC